LRSGEKPERICLGKIVAAHGIRGWLKVIPFTKMERFQELEKILLQDQVRNIEEVKIKGNLVLLKLEGIATRNQSEELVGASIYIPFQERPPLPDGSYYVDDLKGLKVLTVSGELIGELIDVWPLPANDVFLVQNAEGKRIMIPALKEVVKEIDQEKGIIKVEEWGIVL
jgi:16S rRNA processing protein RimM